ncbi:LysM peptidoglycan-binding domain-containing protein [Aliigemmobacter aestuarii]|uniref:LysM peptidoglycan-binding domain-containing protein n=1 Tax=Aliigemmobacter aestuarii TaxID=1445661 RepID=UPI001FE5BF50|nr:LysM peptidoglycan-binding domain-containing protein [Gemmobacter aestuarii]
MKVWNDLGNGARAALLAGGAAVLAGAGWLWHGQAPAPQETESSPAGVMQAEPATASAPAASAPAAAAPESAPAAQDTVAEAAPEAAPEPPGFDTVRIETDGAALVAGRAAPGAGVAVLVDGAEVASVPADGTGAFAALFTLPPSDQPRRMTLEMVLADGARVASTDEVAIAPIAAPVVAAAAGSEAPQPAETAETPPAALLVTDAGAAVLTPPPADVPVSIDAISYAPDGAVLVAGHGAPGQSLRLYLDNADVALAEVGADGTWSAPLTGIAPGLYTLRADQLDAAGKVLSRFETPFKRETVEALAAAAAPESAPPAATAPASDPAPPAASAEAPATAPTTPAPTTLATAAPDQAAPVAPSAPPATASATDGATLTAAEPATPAAAPAGDAAPVAPAPPPPLTVTVQPGFTLWRIARENFGDGVMYVQVFEANRDKIRDPDLIYPGQVFTIPKPAE